MALKDVEKGSVANLKVDYLLLIKDKYFSVREHFLVRVQATTPTL